ncbi:zinc transporter ZntB [Magnetococcales bacterium HHB-1]
MIQEQSEKWLICAYTMTPEYTWKTITQEQAETWDPEQGLVWIHLQQSDQSRAWLEEFAELDSQIVTDLFEADNQPRFMNFVEGGFLTLRGVNLNPGADPEDMVFLNLWVESTRIITVRSQRMHAVTTLRDALDSGIKMPHTIGGFLVRIIYALVINMDPLMNRLDDHLDQLEEDILGKRDQDSGHDLSDVRLQVLQLRRYLAPQRRVIKELQHTRTNWFTKKHIRTLTEVNSKVQQDLEELDSFRERSMLLQDELNRQSDEHMNATIFRLTIITGIFLPLSFLTGLLGINVGGMPGVDNPSAFWFVTLMLTGLGVLGVVLAKFLKWF